MGVRTHFRKAATEDTHDLHRTSDRISPMAQATSVFGDGRCGPGRAPSLPPAGASATRHMIAVTTVSRGRPRPLVQTSIKRRA